MKTLLFLSKGEKSASTRYRAVQYFPLLSAAGFSVAHADMAGKGLPSALLRARKAGVVIVLRKTLPTPLLWLLRRCSRRLVFDFDDAVFSNTDGSHSPTRMQRFAAMLKACDLAFAGNAFLADKARQYNANVVQLPTSLDVARYRAEGQKPSDFFDLVWIGSRSTRKYLDAVIPALREAGHHLPNMRLKVIADFQLQGVGFPVINVPWREESEVAELASAHVGIAPMRDDDWTRGKCALKVLQYMAAGLPVVSSPAGVNAEVVESGKTGLLAEGETQWCESLASLANDRAMLEAFGVAGRAKVAAHYDRAVVGQRMLAAINRLL